MKWYSDFVFWDRTRGNILATESLEEGTEMAYAQKLAQEHRCTVAYGQVLDYFVEPVKCPVCGDVAPADGCCRCSEFEEIPFQGEPMASPPERTGKDFYGV